MIKYIQRMLSALNANRDPGELAHAFSMGILLALIPKGNLLWIMLFIITLFFRINKGALFLTMILGSLFAPLLDPLFDTAGYALLTNRTLTPLFKTLLDIPFVAYTKFNNSIVMGSLLCGLALYIPLYIGARLFIKSWRRKLYPLFSKSKIYKFFTQLPGIDLISRVLKGAKDE